MHISREWIEKHRNKLEEEYDGKTIIVCENEIIRVLDGPVNPIEINKMADTLCKNKDWSYTYLSRVKDYIL